METGKNRIAVIGTAGRLAGSYKQTTRRLFRETGLNTGNLVFQHAVSEFLPEEKHYFGWNVDPMHLRNNFDVLVFPAANQLYPNWEMSHLAEVFEKARLPLIVVGLGAQAHDESAELNFKPGTVRFMKVLSERCTNIGVRGEFTATILEKHGVQNSVVVGCPSNFINSDNALGQSMMSRIDGIDRCTRVLLNTDLNRAQASFARRLIDWSSNFETRVVCQDPESAVSLARGFDHSCEDLEEISDLLFSSRAVDNTSSTLRSLLVTFFDVAAWIEYARRFDLSIGTKLHGNMVAWQAGVPAVFMPHDARVSELIDSMKLPFLNPEAIEEVISLSRLKSHLQFDPSQYDSTRSTLAKRLVDIFRESGLLVNPELLALSGEGPKGQTESAS